MKIKFSTREKFEAYRSAGLNKLAEMTEDPPKEFDLTFGGWGDLREWIKKHNPSFYKVPDSEEDTEGYLNLKDRYKHYTKMLDLFIHTANETYKDDPAKCYEELKRSYFDLPEAVIITCMIEDGVIEVEIEEEKDV